MTATRSRGGRRPSARSTRTRRARSTSAATSRTRSRSGSSQSARTANRFVQRRSDVERQQAARRFRFVLALSMVSMLAVLMIGLLNSSWFDVDSVVVVGAERADVDEIIATSAVVIGQPLLDVDLDHAVDAVRRVPWVGEVNIRRDWTGLVTIAVTERDPVLALMSPSGFVLVDYWGRQIESADSRPVGFLPVDGVEASGRLGEMAPPDAALPINFMQALPDHLAAEITALEVVEGELLADLDAGGRANFGDSSQLGSKFQSLETVLARVDLSCLSMLDLRVPAAPALRRADGSTVTDDAGDPVVQVGGTTC